MMGRVPRSGSVVVPFAVLLMSAALLTLGGAASAQDVVSAEKALAEGRYDDAIRDFENRIASSGADSRVNRGLVQALRETGRYEEAADRARAFPLELSGLLGKILYETGRAAEAQEMFKRAMNVGSPDRLTAELDLAILAYDRGDRDEAMAGFDRFIDFYNSSSKLSSSELSAVAEACRYLGADDPQLFKDALKAYDEAIAADPKNIEPRIKIGELFLEKYQSPDARESFQEVLSLNPNHPRALLGLARVLHFDGSPQALELTQKALEINPNLVPARVFLGRLQLDLENYREASEEAESALAVNPASLEALSLLATARFLSGDLGGFEEIRDRALGQNPRYADFFNHLSDTCVRNRLYGEAAKFAKRALELDEKSWWGFGLLGLNQLRLGDIEEGRKNLEGSFAGDPYNVWIKNTLDLLDTFPSYQETKSPRFSTFIDEKESELLALYATDLLEEAYDRLADRYRYRPGTPIRVEVYPSHADFSVRTIGLAGLGALGVCFGPVLAIDSPSAREKGEFNWGSTLWHELAHTITLGMTDNKVPRWFSEGISVFEERRARPGWGDDVNIGFLMAYKQEKLLPIRELNNGFIRPTYPQQIGISYYQASLICELIEKDYGIDALLDILAGYKQGADTETIFVNALGCDPDCFDEKLAEDLKKRFGKAAASLPMPKEGEEVQAATPESVVERAEEAPDDFIAQLAMGMKLLQEENLDEASKYFERAKKLFPDYAGPDSPYWLLSEIHQKKGNLNEAREELSRFVAINGNHYEAHLQLAELEEKLGDENKAAEMLERALYVYPFEIDLHRRLANLYRGLEHHPGVIRERRALVAAEVVDRAQVIYELALAYFESGDSAGARREVLRALENRPRLRRSTRIAAEASAR